MRHYPNTSAGKKKKLSSTRPKKFFIFIVCPDIFVLKVTKRWVWPRGVYVTRIEGGEGALL